MNANSESVFALAGRTANKINSLHPSQEMIDEIIQKSNHPYWTAIEAVFNPPPPPVETTGMVAEVERSQETLPPLILTPASPAFGEWLKMREELHKFLTGDTVILRDMFPMDDATLARTDITPFFRPVDATNRMAVNWKKKLGIQVWEEADVMKYKNSEGPKIPQLGFINRSIKPDENTLGKNAKSPNVLIKARLEKTQAWLNLYGWCDADNLHFKIMGEHLDSGETLCWFPEDRLPFDRVAFGFWRAVYDLVWLRWYDAGCCNPRIGARLAEFFPFKT